jgi:hypothetical protein
MKRFLYAIVLLFCVGSLIGKEEASSTATKEDAVETRGAYEQVVKELGADNFFLVLGALTNKVQLKTRRAERAFASGDYERAILNWLSAKEIILDSKEKGKIKRLASGVLQLDNVYLDSKKNEVYFYAKVPVLMDGDNPNAPDSSSEPMPFEVVVANPHGRVHETVFVTDARPLHFHTLLVMLGFHNGAVPGRQALKGGKKCGDLLDVFVEYKTMKGETKECHIEDLLYDMKHHKVLSAKGWYFNGPEITRNRYIPDFCGELIVNMMGANVLVSGEKKLWDSQLELVWKDKFDIDKRQPVKIVVRARKGND